MHCHYKFKKFIYKYQSIMVLIKNATSLTTISLLDTFIKGWISIICIYVYHDGFPIRETQFFSIDFFFQQWFLLNSEVGEKYYKMTIWVAHIGFCVRLDTEMRVAVWLCSQVGFLFFFFNRLHSKSRMCITGMFKTLR